MVGLPEGLATAGKGNSLLCGMAQHISGGTYPGKETLIKPTWEILNLSPGLAEPAHLVKRFHTHPQGCRELLQCSMSHFSFLCMENILNYWKAGIFPWGNNLQWLKQTPPMISAWGSWALKGWQKGFLASGCVHNCEKNGLCLWYLLGGHWGSLSLLTHP